MLKLRKELDSPGEKYKHKCIDWRQGLKVQKETDVEAQVNWYELVKRINE